MVLYHVTPRRSVPAILQEGLIPQVGERAALANEQPGVFLFPSLEDMETALGSWLGDLFGDEEELVSLQVTLPDDFPLECPAEYERVARVRIPPDCIRVLQSLG